MSPLVNYWRFRNPPWFWTSISHKVLHHPSSPLRSLCLGALFVHKSNKFLHDKMPLPWRIPMISHWTKSWPCPFDKWTVVIWKSKVRPSGEPRWAAQFLDLDHVGWLQFEGDIVGWCHHAGAARPNYGRSHMVSLRFPILEDVPCEFCRIFRFRRVLDDKPTFPSTRTIHVLR